MATTQAQGSIAEDIAARFLTERKLKIIERNYRIRGGEIDLICRDGEAVVFVEVRLRRSSDYGGAAASITPAKQARLIRAAQHWLARHGEVPCRFDCVLMDGNNIEWLRNAFSAD
jgi:putative endonuclease